MFTVKLCRGQVSRIVEAELIDIYPCGAAPGSDQDPTLRTSAVREISITNGDQHPVYYVADPHNHEAKSAFSDAVEFFDVAYIETSAGATTEVIRAY